MKMKIFVPRDATAVAVGADEVVAAFAQIFRAPIGKARVAQQADIAELAGDHIVAATPGNGARDQLLVAAGGVAV